MRFNLRYFKLSLIILSLFLILTVSLFASRQSDPLLNMSLEELMNINVTFGTFTGIEQSRFPGAMTVITKSDIVFSPARNLLDLIEIYVPGATYVMHYQGMRLGIRGNLSDQNYAYQLLLNGKNMNLKSYYGPFFELQEKDLGSIERIEIISGSGSAVYGPGATAGIINIITKKAEDKQLKIGYQNDLNYRFNGVSLQFSDLQKKLRYYLYGSVYKSQGVDETGFWYIDRAQNVSENIPYGWGYMGPDWGNFGLGTDAPNYLGDYLEKPEVKLHLDLEFGNDIDFWARYSTYNHTLMTQESESQEGPAFSGQLAKYFAAEFTHKLRKNERYIWTNKLGFDSASIRHINLYQSDALPINHIAQRGNSFSENEITYHTLVNLNLSDKYKLAFGGEITYEYYQPEWGMDDDSFILSFQSPIRFAVLSENSGFYKYYGEPIANVVEEDIEGRMFSAFGEVNCKFKPWLQCLLSVRADKHEYSETGVSPRLALISELNPRHLLNLILERSVRLPLFTDLFAQHYLGGEAAKPEVMTGAELKYKYTPDQNLIIKTGLYYYTVDQISWIDETEFTDILGTFDLIGVEPEVRYQKEKYSIGANYSFIKQLDWEAKLPYEAWITGLEGEEFAIENNAENRINNLPAHALKFFVNYHLKPDVRLHLNGRLMWDYQQQDMLDKFVDAHQEYGYSTTINTLDHIIDDLHEHGYAKPSFTSNAALNWKLYKADIEIGLQLYAMNLISYNHIRYVIQFWEPGNLRQYPRQCGFIDEPLTVGINLEWKY